MADAIECKRCGARFEVHLPDAMKSRSALSASVATSRILFIRELRALTGCGLADAKGVLQHLSHSGPRCHRCGTFIAATGEIVTCASCGSLNIVLVPTARI
jgi:hypothetical protein